MPVVTRKAIVSDAPEMMSLLNEIIKTGGTTAHEDLYTNAQMVGDYIQAKGGISCVVATIDGQVVGFQSLEWPYDTSLGMPADCGSIASFVKSGMTGAGIGAALFAATIQLAGEHGVRTIDATIRADNTGGLRYYSKMGFVDHKVYPAIPLRDGTPVDRISKRFDLK